MSGTVLREDLAKAVNDRARKILIRGKEAIVPLKFDEEGNPATVGRLIFKRLTLTDLRFLSVWKSEGWDLRSAIKKMEIPESRAAYLAKKLSCFRDEEAKVKALCEIPTPGWITAKHVENIYDGGQLEESAHKSLQELAKIEGAYKNIAAVNIQQNVFNLPKLRPETEEKLRQIVEAELV